MKIFVFRRKESGGIPTASPTLSRADGFLFWCILLTVLFGTVMVFSAGTAYAEARYGDALYFVKRQTVWLLIGFAVLTVVSRIDASVYKRYTPIIYALSLVLLVLVLVVGFVGNGAQRWISIGPLTIQPSEIAKLSMIMMLAYYFDGYEVRATELRHKRTVFVYVQKNDANAEIRLRQKFFESV